MKNIYKSENKLMFWICTVTIVSMFLVSFYEYKFIPQNQLKLYILSKATIVGLLTLVSLVLIKNSKSILWQNCYAVLSYFYAIQGDQFRPNYYISFFQFFIAQALCFNLSRKNFLTVHILGASMLCLSMFYNFDHNLEILYSQRVFADYISIIVIMLFVGFALFFQVNKAREERDLVNNKFILIGNHASNIIHDIKNLTNAPSIYLELMRQKKIHQNDPELSFIIDNLQNNLFNLSGAIKRLYELIHFKKVTSEKIHASAALENCLSLLAHRLKNVKVIKENSGEYAKLSFNKYAVELIILNILYNSLDAFDHNSTNDPEIKIKLSHNKITFIDNAGGAEKNIADSFNDSDVLQNTGLGLYLIKSSAETYNINVKFKNTLSGLRVDVGML